MGDAVRILKIDTDKNPEISTQLQAGAAGRSGRRMVMRAACSWSRLLTSLGPLVLVLVLVLVSSFLHCTT